MEKIALKVAGVIFLLVALAHIVRVVMMVPVTIAHVDVPLRLSVVGAVVSLALGVWMLKLACCCCKK